MPGNSEVRKPIMISLMCLDFIRLCWLYTGKAFQPLLISANWADLVFAFIPPLLQWLGIKSLRQITGVVHQPLMKRFCLHVWAHLIRTSKSKKSSNPPMSINPSSVISAVGTLFPSGELTFYLAKYSYGCCCHWLAVTHINCPCAEECLPEDVIFSLHQIINSLIAAGFVPYTHPVQSRTTWSLIGLHVPTDVNLGHATGPAKMTLPCILFLFLNQKLKLLLKKRLSQELPDRTINLLAQSRVNSAWV